MDVLVGGNLVSFSAAAQHFKVHNQTIADLVDRLGITPKTISTNGKAKGLDPDDIQKLGAVLRPHGVTSN